MKNQKNFLGIMVAMIVTIIFSGCTSTRNCEFPSTKVLQNYLTKNPNAEKIDTATITKWKNSFATFRSNPGGHLYVDIQSDYEKNLAKDTAYKGLLSMYTASIVDDSVLSVTHYDPEIEKVNKGDGNIHFHNSRYIFHTNGDIELKMGNMLSDRDTSDQEGVMVWEYLNEATGAIVFYEKKDAVEDIYFIVQSDGTVNYGDDYNKHPDGVRLATETLGFLGRDLDAIQAKIQKR